MIENKRYLCFGLGKEEFAIPLLAVKEVLGVPEITPIPQAANYFLGIMNLRGSIISIIDLRLKLGIKAQNGEETSVIILDVGQYNLGVMVDRVNAVVSLSADQLSEKPVINSHISTDFISNVFRKDEILVLLLDIGKALSLEDKNLLANQSKRLAA